MQKEYIETKTEPKALEKLKNFYNKNKLLIILLIVFLIIILASIGAYYHLQEKKRAELSDLYIKARIGIENNKENEAKNILIKIIKKNDKTYSPLSLFLLIDKNLIEDNKKIIDLFDNILDNNNFEKEVRNLIIFKRSIIQSNFPEEEKLLQSLKPIINSDTLWKSHGLLLLGDYFFFKKEFIKAKENYVKILLLPDINNLHEEARHRLALIVYD